MTNSKLHSEVIRWFLLTAFLAATIAVVASGFQEGITPFQALILNPLLILTLGAASCLVHAKLSPSRPEPGHARMQMRQKAHEDRCKQPLKRAA